MSQQFHQTSTIERAFELASSGRLATVEAIKRRLATEGFDEGKICGPYLHKQLRSLLSAASDTYQSRSQQLERIRRANED